uniref:Chromosome 11 open reading frame 16 n=1 Tax=Crocodylus porosus TaxID=8502 RepID=A0A7M4E025_CROPO
PCFPETICKGLMVLEKSMDFANVPVLARRESDGFYYQGTIKQEIKEKRGMYLIEFAKPPALGEKYPAYVQKTSKDDILEYSHGMSHCILPGDKVLAPWESDMVRYGPGTVVLGIETRDPLRASEDEEITVHFWNGKKVKVPLGVALWIPPNLWDRIINMIHMPFTSSLKLMEAVQSTTCCNWCCRPLKTPVHGYTLDRLTTCRWPCTITWTPFHCHYHSMCRSLAHAQCICYHHPKLSTWWPVPSKSPVLLRDTEQKQPNNSISMKLLELEAPKEEESAVVGADAGAAASSSSSSDSESDSEMCLTKSTMVDSAVNTDSSLFEKSTLKDAVKPQWRYWKRSHPKSLPQSPGRNAYSKSEIRWTKILVVKFTFYHTQATPPSEKFGENQHCKSTCTEQQRKQEVLQQKEERERECQAGHRCHTALEIRGYMDYISNTGYISEASYFLLWTF